MSFKCWRPSFSRQKSNRLYSYAALFSLQACKDFIRFFFSLISRISLKASKYSLNSPQRKHHSRYYVAPSWGCMLYMLNDIAVENPEVCFCSRIFICWMRFKIVNTWCRIFLALAAVIVANRGSASLCSWLVSIRSLGTFISSIKLNFFSIPNIKAIKPLTIFSFGFKAIAWLKTGLL